MKLGVLFSGGKDSNLALFEAMKQQHEIVCLIGIVSENKESFMFHTPNIKWIEKQADAIGIPLMIQKTKGEKEKELIDLKSAIKKAIKEFKIEGIVTGAVASVYQASRIQKICDALDIECFNPLWQKNQFEILDDLVKNKFEVIISGVFAYPLDEKLLGSRIDDNFIKLMKELNRKFKINPAGEGGEFESLVLNAPFFKKRLKVVSAEKIYKNYAGVYNIKELKLVNK